MIALLRAEAPQSMKPRDPARYATGSYEEITLKHLDYCRSHAWAGHDPYDALNSPIFNALPLLDCKVARLVATQLLKRSPFNLRSLLRIPATQNPKALGLFLMAALK